VTLFDFYLSKRNKQNRHVIKSLEHLKYLRPRTDHACPQSQIHLVRQSLLSVFVFFVHMSGNCVANYFTKKWATWNFLYLILEVTSPKNGAERVNFYLLIFVSKIEFHVTYSLHFSRVRDFFYNQNIGGAYCIISNLVYQQLLLRS
jgi:hypothetical protein